MEKTTWQQMKMLTRWCVASFLIARAIGLVEKEASQRLVTAFEIVADEIDKFEMTLREK